MSIYPEVHLKPGREKSLLAGHPWLFSGAISDAGEIEPGGLVEVYGSGRFLGIATYNPHTDIALRIFTRRRQAIDHDFFKRLFTKLAAMKEAWLGHETNAYRLVSGESDHCPGLVVDRYADCLTAQFHTLGIDSLKGVIVQALAEVFKPRAIIERSDLTVRRYEGLPDEPVGLLLGDNPGEVEIVENGFRFLVDPLHGQKTGFFLDQRENRQALLRYAAGRRVLNCFSYTGGFSVYAAKVAAQVTSVDISGAAMDTCRRNFELNNYPTADPHRFIVGDVFRYLTEIKQGEYDLILLDPPSFAKSQAHLKSAIKGYTTINSKALEKLPEGGILIAASCTSHVDSVTFIKILHQSAVNAHCSLRLLESREQPADHAYNFAFPEGRYLKFMVTQKWPMP